MTNPQEIDFVLCIEADNIVQIVIYEIEILKKENQTSTYLRDFLQQILGKQISSP